MPTNPAIDEGDAEVIVVATANGQSVFNFDFPIYKAAQIYVEINGSEKALFTHYNVSGLEQANGGTVTLVAAMALTIVIGDDVLIRRVSPLSNDQSAKFSQDGDFRAYTLNRRLDELLMIAQEQRRDVLAVAQEEIGAPGLAVIDQRWDDHLTALVFGGAQRTYKQRRDKDGVFSIREWEHLVVGGDWTAAILQAIVDLQAASTGIPTLDFGYGVYDVTQLLFDSRRGINFLGRGTMDPLGSNAATTLRLLPIDGGDANQKLGLLRLRSSSNLNFKGFMFSPGDNTLLDHLFYTEANSSVAASPLNRFSNIYNTFEDCVFSAPALNPCALATIWLKNTGNFTFRNCWVDGNPVAIRLGKNGDVSPVDGLTTLAAGKAVQISIYNSEILGDIDRINCQAMYLQDNEFFITRDTEGTGSAQSGALTVSDLARSKADTLIHNIWDSTGILVTSGKPNYSSGTSTDSGELYAINNQFAGRATGIRCQAPGNSVIKGNRFIALSTSCKGILAEAGSGYIDGVPFNDWSSFKTQNALGSVVATAIVDNRTLGTTANYILNAGPGADTAITAAIGTFAAFVSTTEQLIGCNLRIRYNAYIENGTDANTNYGARVMINGVNIGEASGRISIAAASGFGVLTADTIVRHEATTAAVTIALEIAQLNNAVKGTVLASNLARTWITVELCD